MPDSILVTRRKGGYIGETGPFLSKFHGSFCVFMEGTEEGRKIYMQNPPGWVISHDDKKKSRENFGCFDEWLTGRTFRSRSKDTVTTFFLGLVKSAPRSFSHQRRTLCFMATQTYYPNTQSAIPGSLLSIMKFYLHNCELGLQANSGYRHIFQSLLL